MPSYSPETNMNNQNVYDKVREHYSKASQGDDRDYGRKVAKEFGYSIEELDGIPEDSNLGLSCGNPLALANVKEVCSLSSWPFSCLAILLNIFLV